MSFDRKTAQHISIFLVTFLVVLTTQAFGLENYYLLKKATHEKDQGNTAEAIIYYNRYIVTHPTVLGERSAKYQSNRQYYIRNLLIAYKHLINLYRAQKNDSEIDTCINQLKSLDWQGEFRPKNKYSLALIFLDNNFVNDAEFILTEIVTDHAVEYFPHNNKAALRSLSKLFQIYQTTGKKSQLFSIRERVKSDFPVFDFDLKDKYKLASIYVKYGFNHDGICLLEEIIENQSINSDLSEISTIINTYTKLLSHYFSQDNNEKLDTLYMRMSAQYPPAILSPVNQYKLAITYLNCGKEGKGIQILESISSNYPCSLSGKKALFLLGRLSEAKEDWRAAIHYFSTYIDRYPESTFFTLKAYSRLIDAYWSSGEYKQLVRGEIERLADIVNNISDFETQLNLARDLKWKGMDELADATFNIGLTAAEKQIQDNRDTYTALQIHWMIEKYAYHMERFNLVEQSADSIFALISRLKNPSPGEKERIKYIENQTLLWMAKVKIDQQDFNKAKTCLETFIQKFSDHEEINYARYELGRIFEKQRDADEALLQYGMIESGIWKQKACQRSAEIKTSDE